MKNLVPTLLTPGFRTHIYQPCSAVCATSEQSKQKAEEGAEEQSMLRVGDGPFMNLGRTSERRFRPVLRVRLDANRGGSIEHCSC